MELKTRDNMEIVKHDEVERMQEIKQFIPIVRNAVSKSWRLMDKLDKMLTNKEE